MTDTLAKIIPILYLGQHEVPTLLCSTLAESAYEDIMDAALHLRPLHSVFLDVPASEMLAKLVRELRHKRLHSIVRSNRFNEDDETESQLRLQTDATSRLTSRMIMPAAESLVVPGEFNHPNLFLIVEATPSGFITLVKAMGVQYAGQREDSTLLYDHCTQPPLGVTAAAELLLSAWQRLPKRTSENHSQYLKAVNSLFVAFNAYAQGVTDQSVIGPLYETPSEAL